MLQYNYSESIKTFVYQTFSARSNQIQVMINTEYHLGSYFSSILPCVQNDIKTLTVQRPYCAPMSDKVRAFGQGKQITHLI